MRLENRRFLGYCGPKTAAHGCMDGASAIRDQLVKNHNCPQIFAEFQSWEPSDFTLAEPFRSAGDVVTVFDLSFPPIYFS